MKNLSLCSEQARLLANWHREDNIEAPILLTDSQLPILITDIPTTKGTGQFFSIEFDQISFSKLNCHFDKFQRLENQNCAADCGIYVILKGSFEFTCPLYDIPIQLNAPAIWLFKGLRNQRIASTIYPNTTIQAFFINFNPEFIDTILKGLKQDNTQNTCALDKCVGDTYAVHVPLDYHNHILLTHATTLFSLSIADAPLARIALQGQILAFIAQTLQNPMMPLPQQDKMSSALRVKQLLDTNPDNNDTIRTLAHKSRTNECYLKQTFKVLTGLTIVQYRQQQRMQQAIKLLAKGQSLADTAEILGYHSVFYFIKVFQNFYHCHPTQYLPK